MKKPRGRSSFALVLSLGLSLACFAATASEVFYLDFDEGSGTNSADNALSDGTPTPDDSVTLVNGAHFAPGKYGTSLELSNTAAPYQYAAFRNSSLGDMMTNAPGATFACWMMVPSNLWSAFANSSKGDLLNIALPNDPTHTRFEVQVWSNATIWVYARCNDTDPQTTTNTGPNMFRSNQWIHIAGVANYTNKSLTIYTNGQVAVTCTGITNWGANPMACSGVQYTNACIGMNSGSGIEAFNGRIDEARFWNGPLSAAQVAAVYAQDPTTTNTLTSSTNSIAYGQTLTLTAKLTVTGTNVPTGTVTFMNGTNILGTGTLSGTTNATATFSTNSLLVGTYTNITAVFSGDNNFSGSTSTSFTQTVTKASATVTLGSLSQSYDRTAKAATASTTPSGLTVNLTYNGLSNAPTNAGSYTVIGTINDINYQGSATNTLVITAASVTITSGLSANNKVYDGSMTATISSNNVVLSGVVAGDSANVSLSTNGYTANFATASVGTGKSVTVSGLSLSGSAAGNYSLTQPSLSANITVATVSVTSGLSANNKVYDGTTVATISSNSVVLSGVVAGDSANVSLNTNGYTANFATASVGTGRSVTVSGLSLSGGASGNYSLTQPSLSANITVASVTITSGLSANNKVYDGSTTATISSNNVVLSGVMAGDTANVKLSTNGYTANFASATVGNGKSVTVSGLSLSGGASGNYSLTQPAGLTANISVASVTITSGLSANNKVYDGSTTATISSNNVVLSGVVAGDSANVSLSTNGYTANFASATVGNGKSVTVSGLSLSGGASGNYSLTQPSLSANITVATVSVTSGLSANNKVYDGSTTATISSNNVVLSGVVAGDSANVSLSTNGYTANFATASVGTGKSVTVSGLSLSGSASGNYSLTQPAGLTANISVASVTITSGLSANNKVYDGSTTATISSNNVVLSGVVAGDSANVSLNTNGYTANFATASVGTGKSVTVSGLSLSGSAAGNYSLTQPSLSANITVATVSVTSGLSANNKVYDGSTTATISSNNVVLSGVMAGDSANVSLSTNGYTANFASGTVGNGKSVTVSGLSLSGSAAGNYSLTQPSLSANITVATVSVTSGLSANNKVYDGSTTVTINSNNVVLSGVVAGDSANVSLSTNGYTANFATASVGTGKSVTVSGLSLSGSASGNYSLTQPAGLTANISVASVTITSGLSANNKVYDGSTTATISSNNVVLSGVMAGDTANVKLSTNGYTANFASATVGNGKSVTVSGLSLSGGASGNYSLTQPSLSANITVATVSVTSGLSANNKVYDGSTTATISSNNVVLSGVMAGDSANVSLSTNGYTANFATASVGTGRSVTVSGLSLSGSAAGNYSLTQPSLSANITVATVSVTSGLSANNKVYDGSTTVTINSNNVVLSGVVAGDSANVSLSTNGYTANFATASVGTGKSVTVSGLSLSGSAAGNYSLTQPSLSANISVASVTITSGLSANNKVYDGSTTATISSNNVVLSGVVAGDSANVSLSTNGCTANFATASVGTGKSVTVSGLSLSGSASGNYSLTQPSLTANITVATVSVTSGLSANNKVYDGSTTATISSNNVVLSGVMAGDSANVSLNTNGYTANFATASVGTGKSVTVSGLSLSGGASGNYSLTQPSLSANITVATVSVTSGLSANNKVYDGTTVATISSNNVVLSGVVAGDSANVSLNTNGYTANFATASVGTGRSVTVSGLSLSGSASGNYSLTQPAGLTANISVASVTITSGLSANNKVYDGSTTATISSNNVVLSGVMAGDTANVKLSTNGYTANFASATVGNGKSVTVSGLSLSGGASGNYSLTQPSLSANITVATVSVTSGLSANNKVYDGSTTATISSNSVVLSGVVAGDSANVSLNTNGYTANFATASVGTGRSVTVSGLSLSGGASGNYSLTQPSLSANITVASVTITSGLSANNKVYDGSTTATISSNNVVLSGVVAGDSANVSLNTNGYTANFASATVGNGKSVTVSGLSLSGSAAGNYSLTQPSLSANITVATVSVTSGLSANNKVYDGSTTATISSNNVVLSGVAAGDSANVSLNTNGYTANFNTPTVGTGKSVTVSGLSLSGGASGNYSLTQPSLSANITVKGLTITANNVGKTYGQTLTFAGTEFTASGLVGGDTVTSVTLTSSGTAATASVSGSPYSIVPSAAVGTGLANYTVTYASGTLTVNRATLTVGANDTNRVYGAANPAFTTFCTGFVNGENTNVLSGAPLVSTGAGASSPVGGSPYSITVSRGTLSAANYDFAFEAGQLTLTKATLTVSADNKTKDYGAPLPVLTASYSGFVNGEDTNVLSGAPALSTSADTNSPVSGNPYPIIVSQGSLTSGNYDFTFANGILIVKPAGSWFYDDFVRATDPGSLWPWILETGTWTITNGVLEGSGSPNSYGNVYIATNWTDYSVEARIQFPEGAFGGGLSGRLDPATGARYAAWIYPSGAAGGSNVLELLRFSDWSSWTLLGEVSLSEVGTNWHTLELAFQGTNISVFYDTNLVIQATDTSDSSGGIGVEMWTSTSPYAMSVDDVVVRPIAPAILGQPLSQRVNLGSPVTFTVSAYGTPPLSYQWQLNSTNIPGATNASLSIAAAQDSDAGLYTVLVTSTDGSVTNSNATLTLNHPPGLAPMADQTVNEQSTLTLPISAGDADGGPLTYTLLAAPAGASIDTNGVITWTPTSAQGPSTNTFTVQVSDDGSPALTASESFTVVVHALMLTMPDTQIINESATLTVTATATDSANPTAHLTFSLVSAPGGMTINPGTGVITWTPTEAQGLGAWVVVVSVVDDEVPPLSDTNRFQVIVREVNLPPTLTVPANQTLSVGVSLCVTNTATDPNVPANTLTFSLASAPNGMKINPTTGVVTWTPSSSQRPSTNVVTVQVTDNGVPPLSDTKSFVVVAQGTPAPPDLTKPTVFITSPAANARNYGAAITVSGIAQDNKQVAQVLYSLNGAPFAAAVGTTNWSAVISLSPGTNIFAVKSVDTSGNESVTVTRNFFQVVNWPLNLTVNGGGSVTPYLNGAMLELGRSYTVMAIPLPDNTFTGWSGDIGGTNYTVSFLMQTNLALVANFATNPFVAIAGSYNGLFSATNGVRHESAGFVTLKVTKKRSYSGKLLVGGGSYSMSGVFDAGGVAHVSVARKGKSALAVTLQLDLVNQTDEIHGTVSAEGWSSDLTGDRAVFNASANPATGFAGQYTMIIPGCSNAVVAPAGEGYGLITVGSNGVITLAASAYGDGAVIKQTVPISKAGYWPLYVPLYSAPFVYTNGFSVVTTKQFYGSLFGWILFGSNGSPGLSGTLVCSKEGIDTAGYYPNGFTNVTEVEGSSYMPPVVGQRALTLTNMSVVLEGGNLPGPLGVKAVLTTDNALVVQQPNLAAIKLQLVTKSGMLKGTFVNAANSNNVATIKGVVLQNVKTAGGFFLGSTQSGSVSLQGN